MNEYASGIYYVEGHALFPIQIVVTRRLGTDHHWLRALTNRITETDLIAFTKATGLMVEQGQRNYIDAIYQISVMTNMEAYERLKRRCPEMCDALRILMKPEFDEAIKEAKDQGVQQGVQQGMQEIVTIISRLKSGATQSSLLEEGYSKEGITMAIKAMA